MVPWGRDACVRSIFHDADGHGAELVLFSSFGGDKVNGNLWDWERRRDALLSCHDYCFFASSAME